MTKTALQRQRYDYIDSCIFLHHIFEEGTVCRRYLNLVGYKRHNKGMVSHFVMGEIVINLLLKLKKRDPVQEILLKERAFLLLDDTIRQLRANDNLLILRLTGAIADTSLFKELKAVDAFLTDDDALHLLVAIKEGCSRFVTLDQELAKNERLRQHLIAKYNMRILDLNNQI